MAEFELTQWLRDPAALNLDFLDECRLLEIPWVAKQILAHLDSVDLEQMVTSDADRAGSGRGSTIVEAPQGVLVHYLVSRGTMERMRLLVATQFNNAYINLVLRDLAERHVHGDGLSDAGDGLFARGVRVFDPCLTCAAH